MRRILVVDDQSPVRGLFREVLERAGYQVIDADDTPSGLEVLKGNGIDLAFVDIFMPGDGLELIRQARSAWPELPLVAISGGGRYGLTRMLSVAQRLGAVRTMQKPFEPEEIVRTAKAVLGEEGDD